MLVAWDGTGLQQAESVAFTAARYMHCVNLRAGNGWHLLWKALRGEMHGA